MATTKQVMESINRRLGSIELHLSALGGGTKFSVSADEAHQAPHCSFCGKTSREVSVMIAGPVSIFMCCECVMLAAEIVAEHSARPSAQAQDATAQAPHGGAHE